jgi:osmotically-inducible protein OsmY
MKRIALVPLVFAAAAALIVTGTALHASEADDGIVSTFKNTYVFKNYLSDDDVKAVAINGAVTLTGTVSEEFHKTLAAETAGSIPGVTGVDNRLSTKAELAAENADLWIGRKVKLALMLHRNVNATKTTVDVKDGVVTLKGEAANAAQKDLTAEYAGDIEGVKVVKNELTVASAPIQSQRTEGEKLDDASIVAQVKMALATQRSTSSLKPKVEARNGEVTLTGIAQNAAEKSLVTKRVSDVHGVTAVKNEMTVAEPMTK